MQLHMMSAFSQFERALLKERQADGIAAKKALGEKNGRPCAYIKKVRKLMRSEVGASDSGSPATLRALASPHTISFAT